MLEVRRDFTNWFKYHVKINGLVEGRDYFKVTNKDRHSDEDLDSVNSPNLKKGRGGDYKSVDYDIYIDTAKHFLLASQTPMAHTIRQLIN